MLDKSVPYIDVMMKRMTGTEIPEFPLPEGYSFELFQSGDEKHWAQIEAAADEFASPIDGLLYFQREFLPYSRELVRRCVFAKSPEGEYVGTATAWWDYAADGKRHPWLHWVAVKPAHQNRGIGKAIVSKTIRLLYDIEGDFRDYYLHTQTWSHVAIGIYEKCGFTVTDEKNIGHCANDRYEEAVALLKTIREGK